MSDQRFERETLSDFDRASSLEWLEANGLGGWASSTVSGAHTRRYHGLLVAATKPPAGRRVLLAKLDATLVLPDGARIELDANRYPGAIHPRGFERLVAFAREPFPTSTFEANGIRLRRVVGVGHGENTTYLTFELLAAPAEAAPIVLELRPMFAGRDMHSLARASAAREWRASEVAPPGVRFASAAEESDVWIEVTDAEYLPESSWYFDFEYSEERARGFDFRDDLHVPGVFRVALAPGRPVGVVASTERGPRRDAVARLAAEAARRERLVAMAAPRSELERRLVLAADSFLVRRGERAGSGGGPGWTLIAGYPWFADWGRDAMIALPGLCLETGRFVEAREILRGFAAAASEGMLPNRFPEAGEAPEYNTVDAALWLFVATQRYLDATDDDDCVRDELLPVLDEILGRYGHGTRYGIRADGDGLLLAGEPGVQLTWMDARVGERVITPRHGKPVEIEALWVNAIAIAAALHRRYGNGKRAAMLSRLAKVARSRFEELFWNAEKGELYDVVAGERRDPASRPNQLYALALPHPLLGRERALAVLDAVERKLVTPRGLRSLAADEPEYAPRYEGGPEARDAVYHQGTVWSFLAGIYVDALVRYRGAKGRRQAREFLDGFAAHLDEAGLGTISEIFDGDPTTAPDAGATASREAGATQTPRGAFSQAWSVGELLRALRKVRR